MGIQKPNIGLDITPTYRSRDTAHVQHLNWHDPLVYSQNTDIKLCPCLKNYKTNLHKNLAQDWDRENVSPDARMMSHKSKMADGCHVENCYTAISQQKISNFDQIWYRIACLEPNNKSRHF